MSQLMSRKRALRSLRKFTMEKLEDAATGGVKSPAEVALLDALVIFNERKKRYKDHGCKMGRMRERAYKQVKFLARSLGIMPATQDEFDNLYKAMRIRSVMGVPVYAMFFHTDWRGGTNSFIREMYESELKEFFP